jgi:hypothetical protein
MAKLFDAYLPIVQDLNDYGGNFTTHQISRSVLDAVDAGAEAGDTSLTVLRKKLLATIASFRGLQDHETFSAFFEAFYEAVFYLVAVRRGFALRSVPAGSKHGMTPDFATAVPPDVRFEVKTINVADPARTYDKTMTEGLDAKLEAQAHARRSGVGMAARSIAPHGAAKDRLEAVEQVMKKIDGNVKHEQYAGFPTFLVVSLARTALHDSAENLKKRLVMFDCVTPASGQLFAVAAHRVGDEFYFLPERPDRLFAPFAGEDVVSLGPLHRNGILLDHPFIAGLIFLETEWNKSATADALDEAYRLNGVWNLAWERSEAVSPEIVLAAKQLFERLCHAYNDTDDTHSELLPNR